MNAAYALLTLVLAGATANAGGAGRFLRELETVERRIADGAHAEAEGDLRALLDEHADEAYVLLELERVRSALEECAFAAEYGEPALADLLPGELLAWDEQSGELHLRLRIAEATRAELLWEDGRWWYPVPFGGPGSLRLRGVVSRPDDDPDDDEEKRPATTLYARLALGLPGASCTTFELAVGTPAADGEPSVRARVEGERPRELESDEPSPLAVGEPGAAYELELRVSERRLFLKDRGETLLHVPRPRDVYGRFGWADLPGLVELELEGEPDADWLAALPARRRGEAFARWKERHDVALPAWIEEWLATRSPPVLTDSYEGRFCDRAIELLDAEDWEGVLAHVASEGPRVEGAARWFPSWYAAMALASLGRHAEALERVDEVLARSPRYERGLELRERLLRRLGWGRLSELQRAGDPAAGLAFLDSPEATSVDAFARAWYASLFHEALGARDEAFAAAEEAGALRPEDAQVLRRRGRLRWERGLWASALADARTVERLGGTAYDLAARLLLLGRIDEAAAVADGPAGERAGDEREPWADLRRQFDAARAEPELMGSRRTEGRTCVVVTGLPERDARAAADAFDETLAIVARFVGRVPEGEDVHEPIPVYLFHSPDRFERYRSEVLGSQADAVWGVHSSWCWRVAVQWRLPRQSLRTVRHEAVHNALARRFASPPGWLHEGLACYLSSAALDGDTVVVASEADRFDRFRALADDAAWLPWKTLLATRELAEATTDARAAYAQSLALVTVLLEDDAWRPTWTAVVEELASGGGPEDVAARLAEVLPELDRRARERVRELAPR